MEHHTTAWERGGVQTREAKRGLLGSWEGAAPDFKDIPVTLLYRTVLDRASDSLVSHAPVPGLEGVVVEYPHINSLKETLPVRYLFMSVGSTTGVSRPPLGYQRVDLHTGAVQRWFAQEHTFSEELVVVPKEPPTAISESGRDRIRTGTGTRGGCVAASGHV